ncbi:MAG: phosphate-starvation-inducible PsiE family protein [Pseudoxanthomonas sp.]
MNQIWPGERFANLFEKLVLSFVQIFLMILILLAVLDLAYLLWRGVTTTLWWTESVVDLQKGLQFGFAGALLIMIGLELLETTRAYLHERHIRLEVIVVVALIALGRHLIQLDAAHLNGVTLIGMAALIAALMAGYWVIRRGNRRPAASSGSAVSDSAGDAAR